MKKCSKCGVEYILSFFNRDKSSKDGHRSDCKDCSKKYRELNRDRERDYRIKNSERIKEVYIKYRIENNDKINEKKREYYLNNKEVLKEKSKKHYNNNRDSKLSYQKKYQKDNRESRNLYLSVRRNNDPLFKLITNVRNLIYNSFYYNGYGKNSKTEELLGCSFDELKIYLESRFEQWMNWENRGLYNSQLNHGWDIDHIIPLSSSKSEDDVIRLNHYTNLQPLCSHINRDIKKDKLEYGII